MPDNEDSPGTVQGDVGLIDAVGRRIRNIIIDFVAAEKVWPPSVEREKKMLLFVSSPFQTTYTCPSFDAAITGAKSFTWLPVSAFTCRLGKKENAAWLAPAFQQMAESCRHGALRGWELILGRLTGNEREPCTLSRRIRRQNSQHTQQQD